MVSKTRIFTKNLLKFLFSGSEKPLKNATLRAKFITDKVINDVLNTEITDYNKAHSLTFEQTNAIINHFAITPDEINEAVNNQKAHKNKLRKATKTILTQQTEPLNLPQIPTEANKYTFRNVKTINQNENPTKIQGLAEAITEIMDFVLTENLKNT